MPKLLYKLPLYSFRLSLLFIPHKLITLLLSITATKPIFTAISGNIPSIYKIFMTDDSISKTTIDFATLCFHNIIFHFLYNMTLPYCT